VDDQNAVVIRAVEELDQRVFGAQVNGFNGCDLHGTIPSDGE
jgi:hypothetical protein